MYKSGVGAVQVVLDSLSVGVVNATPSRLYARSFSPAWSKSCMDPGISLNWGVVLEQAGLPFLLLAIVSSTSVGFIRHSERAGLGSFENCARYSRRCCPLDCGDPLLRPIGDALVNPFFSRKIVV